MVQLQQEGERAQQFRRVLSFRVGGDGLRHQLGYGLLEGGAGVLEECRFRERGLAPREAAGDGERHRPERRETREQSTETFAVSRVVTDLRGPLLQKYQAGIDALGAAPLESEFRVHLRPAVAFLSHQRVCGQLHVVEMEFAEIRLARAQGNGANRDAGQP